MRTISTDDLEIGMVVIPAHLDPIENQNCIGRVWHKRPYWSDRRNGQMKWEIGCGNQLNGWWTSEEWIVLREASDEPQL